MLPVIPNISANNSLASTLQAISAPNIPMIPAPGTMPAIAPIVNSPQPTVQLRLVTPANTTTNSTSLLPSIPHYDANNITNRKLDNIGKRWTKEEEAQVVSSLLRGITIANTANNIGRTPRSVKMRILQILNNKFISEGVYDGRNTSEGWTSIEACQKYQVTYTELLEFKSQASQSPQANRYNTNNTLSNLGQLPIFGAIPQLPQLGTLGLNNTPIHGEQIVLPNSTQVNSDPILVEIRDLLLAMNRKLDINNNNNNNNNNN